MNGGGERGGREIPKPYHTRDRPGEGKGGGGSNHRFPNPTTNKGFSSIESSIHGGRRQEAMMKTFSLSFSDIRCQTGNTAPRLPPKTKMKDNCRRWGDEHQNKAGHPKINGFRRWDTTEQKKQVFLVPPSLIYRNWKLFSVPMSVKKKTDSAAVISADLKTESKICFSDGGG